MKRRLSVLLVLALAIALIIPSAALAFNWVESPGSPLVRGGVHSVGRFESLFLHNTKVRNAIKGVLKADKAPSWVYAAAVAKAKAGDVHSAFLGRGSRIGAMAFGPRTTKILKNTIWRGSFKLPYYYVVASQDVVANDVKVTTSYRVCLAKTCGNPFVFHRVVTSTPLPRFNLFVEKRASLTDGLTVSGPLLGGWEVTGTVGGVFKDVTTTDTAATLVGSFTAGTPYSLSEVMKQGWLPVPPQNGMFSGAMPASDLTLTFVNERVAD